MIKNTANQQITFGAIALTDGLPITTGTPVVYLSKDNAAQAASTNTAAHVGHGLWRLDLTQTETDANHLGGVMVLANAVNAFAQAFPLTLADFKSDATAANQTSISNAIAALKDFDSASDVVAHVTLVDTTTTLTNQTSGDATIANQTAISNAIAALNDFNASSDAVANVTLVATCTTNTDQRGTDNANLVAPDNAGITSNGNAIAALVAPDNAGITSNGNAIAALNDTTPQQVWDALTSGTYVSGSFGERVLRSTNTNNEIQVTGSNHVAADVHEFQTDAIDADAIAADAVTEIQTGLVLVGQTYTHTNQASDTMQVTIS